MAQTKHTCIDGSLDMRFKVNKKAVQAQTDALTAKIALMKEKALRLAEKAIEPAKVEPATCCICMDEVATQKGHAKLDCGHTYCISCFTQHARLSNKCPLCRDPFAPEPKKEREKIPTFVISDQVQNQLERLLPSLDDVDTYRSYLNGAQTQTDAYRRLHLFLRSECLSAAIAIANWYEPSADFGFRNTNAENIESALIADENRRIQRAGSLARAAENVTAASAGNMESVAMEVDPNPPPGFAPRRLFADEDGLNRGSSSLAEAAARASELVGSANPDLASSDSIQGNPEQDFISLEPEFEAFHAASAFGDVSSPPEDGEVIEDDTLERYFDQAASEAESELAEAVAEAAEATARPWRPPTPPRQQTQADNAEMHRRAVELEDENTRLRAEVLAGVPQDERAEEDSQELEEDWRPWRRARAARRQQAHDGILYDPVHDD